MRAVGVALALVDIQTIMISMIETHAPEIFARVVKDGGRFQCSELFVRLYLRGHHWSMRRPTRAAQKVPDDAEKQCEQSFFR